MPASNKRDKKVRNGFKTVDLAWDQITKTSNNLRHAKCLTKGQSNRFRSEHSAGSRGAKKHRQFLGQVRDIDSDYYVLCAIAFSQNQIDSTKTPILDGLVKRIREKRNNTTVIHPNIQFLVADSNSAAMKLPQESSNGSWSVLSRFMIEGIRDVFGEVMLDKIKRVQRDNDNDNNNDHRDVAMHFPSWLAISHLDPCFLSLAIREEHVKELAMALFKVKVDWVTDSFHVVYHNGTALTIPHSQFTLKGVLHEDVFAVFTTQIHDAIVECPIWASELAQGKRLTECVSMNFSRSEATIQLAMGLSRGIGIHERLNSKIVA